MEETALGSLADDRQVAQAGGQAFYTNSLVDRE